MRPLPEGYTQPQTHESNQEKSANHQKPAQSDPQAKLSPQVLPPKRTPSSSQKNSASHQSPLTLIKSSAITSYKYNPESQSVQKAQQSVQMPLYAYTKTQTYYMNKLLATSNVMRRSEQQNEKYRKQVQQLHQLINTEYQPIQKEMNPCLKEELLKDYSISYQRKAVYLYCYHKANIKMVAKDLGTNPSVVCKNLKPAIITAIRLLQSIVNKRNLRKMAIRWSYAQLKDFRNMFFQIKNGRMFGHSKRVNLKTFFKLMKMSYQNSTILISNQQAAALYEQFLDLHLKFFVHQNHTMRNKDKDKNLNWNREELKYFCNILKKTNNFDTVEKLMKNDYGDNDLKYSKQKLYLKLQSVLKGTIGKLKHQCLLYPTLGRVEKMELNDFSRVAYGGHDELTALRRSMIDYFLVSTPSFVDTFGLIVDLNIFTQESQRFDRKTTKQQHDEQNNLDSQDDAYKRQLMRQALKKPQFIRQPSKQPQQATSTVKIAKGQYSRQAYIESIKVKTQTDKAFHRPTSKRQSNLYEIQQKLKQMQSIKHKKVNDQMQVYESQVGSQAQETIGAELQDESFEEYDKADMNEFINPMDPFKTVDQIKAYRQITLMNQNKFKPKFLPSLTDSLVDSRIAQSINDYQNSNFQNQKNSQIKNHYQQDHLNKQQNNSILSDIRLEKTQNILKGSLTKQQDTMSEFSRYEREKKLPDYITGINNNNSSKKDALAYKKITKKETQFSLVGDQQIKEEQKNQPFITCKTGQIDNINNQSINSLRNFNPFASSQKPSTFTDQHSVISSNHWNQTTSILETSENASQRSYTQVQNSQLSQGDDSTNNQNENFSEIQDYLDNEDLNDEQYQGLQRIRLEPSRSRNQQDENSDFEIIMEEDHQVDDSQSLHSDQE